ncbi:MarR family transcriptional regulator [Rhizobium sp. WW_1]|uniref:MarR family winged helix-turn-helix transcriptional regulator n=1 Tax=unclassified Rhizobium TaxID=2613769 RepID=UPI0032AF5B7C
MYGRFWEPTDHRKPFCLDVKYLYIETIYALRRVDARTILMSRFLIWRQFDVDDRAGRAAAQWRKELPDIDADVMATVGRLLEAARLIERGRLTPFAARFGLQKGEFDVIASLRRAGPPYELTPTDLYDALMLSSGAMTSRLDRLEQAGLIERRPAQSDRRSVRVRLTEKGLGLIEEILPLHIANEKEALGALTDEERSELDRLLVKLVGGLADT